MNINEAAEKYAEHKSSSSVFREAHINDFKAGAKWQAEQKQVSAGVWVKASERLPEVKKQVCGRLNGVPAIVWNSSLIDGYVTANGNLERVEDVEWLDESAQQKQVPTDEEIDKLAKEKGCGGLEHIFIKGFKGTLQYSVGGFSEELEADFELLYKKLHVLAINVDGSIVSNIKETVNKIYKQINNGN